MHSSWIALSVSACVGAVGCSFATEGTGSFDGAPPRPDSGRIDLDAGARPDAARFDGGIPLDSCAATSAADLCNGVDDDCDGMVDEDQATRPCGVGTHCANRCVAGAFAAACENVDVSMAVEICGNGDDDDCDGMIDELCVCTPGVSQPCGPCMDGTQPCGPDGTLGTCTGGTSRVAYYVDADMDGYGNPAASTLSCTPVSGSVTNAADCNDACATCTPITPESCDGLDNDCDGTPDDGLALVPYYQDADGDGFGGAAGSVTACASPGAGWTTTGGDCDDTCARCRPDYPAELCRDGRDNNCNGMTDEAACPCDIHTLATGTYLYCRNLSWDAGRTMCMRFAGDLVVFESAAENAAVWAAMSPYATYVWFGASDTRSEGRWVWVNGTTMSDCTGSTCVCAAGAYCNWHSGQPNSGASDNCLVVNPSWAAGDWGDYPCGTAMGAICELR